MSKRIYAKISTLSKQVSLDSLNYENIYIHHSILKKLSIINCSNFMDEDGFAMN